MPSALQSRGLRRIIAAYTINRLGTWFGYVALSLAVFEHTHSALAVAALLVAGQALPALLVPALVARVETSPRRAKLSALYVFEALLTIALAVLMWQFWLPAVIVLAALDGAAALAASALLRAEAARAASDQLAPAAGDVAADERPDAQTAEREANAALNVAFSATFALGPVLGGVLVAAAGAPVALLVDAASFLVCAAMVMHLRPQAGLAESASVRDRLRAAWEHIDSVPALKLLLLAEGLALVFFAADGSIEVPYAKVTLLAGDRGYGLLLTVWGLGVVAGSLAFARAVRRPLGVTLSAGTLAVGLAYIGFAAAPSLAVACVAGFVGGLGNGVQWASLLSAVQQLTPQRLHGQLMGAVEAIGAFCPGMGLLLGGALVAIGSPRSAFLVVGVGAAAMTVAFVRLASGLRLPPRADVVEPLQPAETATSLMHEPTSVSALELGQVDGS
ncbi:MAG TPA: MFS transporter [Solirubrobacteraceae bacterium]|nr:MFS transporter [Solirubrobacteraceae bacterium]